jgi:pantothenate kinase
VTPVERLFSYGTLRLPQVQRELFGAELPTTPDTLVGWRLRMLRITDAAVLAMSGEAEHPILEYTGAASDRVDGAVLELTPDQLAAADRYEVDDYRRVRASLASGLEAWVYAGTEAEGAGRLSGRRGGKEGLALLAERARRLHEASGGRVLVGITGSPGSGKTTLARALVAELNERADASAAAPFAVHLPMDGFHLANATLERLGLRQRKGAIETFDGWGFVALLERIRREVDHTVYAPAFEREGDEPVAGEIAIEASARIVVVEGNYLLNDVEPWRRVRDLLDEAWFCDTADDERMLRLVRRHTEFGRTPAAARAWAREVDGANARRIAPARKRADLVVSGITWKVLTDRRG